MSGNQRDRIVVRGATEHNLKGVDVELPRNALTVVTGVSGSGKSSLVFDTLCREGQRRYFEAFSTYARQFLARLSRPAVAQIDGLSPALSIDQRAVVRSPRSTVGTLTELYDYLRLLFARLGQGPEGLKLERRLFSFNVPHGACPACNGLGVQDRIDPELLVADPSRTLREGALVPTTPSGYIVYSQITMDALDTVCRAHGFHVDIPWRDLAPEQREVVLRGSERVKIPYGKHTLESRLRWKGITPRPREEGFYKGLLTVMEQTLKRDRNKKILRFVRSMPCGECGGARLRPEALAVRFHGRNIAELAALTLDALGAWLEAQRFDAREAPVAEPVREEMLRRIGLLRRLGLGYLTLDRESTTLSGGEAQRIRLASQVGCGLRGILYILDEPSMGLHPRDNRRLLEVLRLLRDNGNTVVAVEHDEETIRSADWLIDIGPGAGVHGGELLFSGPGHELLRSSDERLDRSRTRAFLTGREANEQPKSRRAGNGHLLRVPSACARNLKGISPEFRLGAFNVLTGVSGAGKSTLLEEILARWDGGELPGRERLDKVIVVDQSPIGRTPRSNPATYTGLFDLIRDLFASLPEAKARGFDKGRFSFNVSGGRCEACGGAGCQQVGMHFLGVFDVRCEACGGKRFNEETLAVRYRGRSIFDVLEMPVDQAAGFFADLPKIHRVVESMRELGLGYLTLGQPSTTLSGGEAQRVKLASELCRPSTGATLYLLDEPTVGLHMADVQVLLRSLQRLVDLGNTVVAIEHDRDFVRAADWIVDLGPESGEGGGRIVVAGTPEDVASCAESHTGAALLEVPPLVRPSVAARGTREAESSNCAAEQEPPPGHPERRGDQRSPRSRRACSKPERPFDSAPAACASGATLRANGGGTGVVEEPFDSAPAAIAPGATLTAGGKGSEEPIRLRGVSTHNIKGIDVEIPANKLTVITGVSGSGKSSLAFDTLFAEGQNRFTDSFSTYARRFVQKLGKPDIEEASGLTPALAIRQKAGTRNPRSTVGTMTEVLDHLRLVYSRAGKPYCPECGEPVGGAACPCGFIPTRPLTASLFSFNDERGACPECKGLGHARRCDPEKLVSDPSRALWDGAMAGSKPGAYYGDPFGQHMAILRAVGEAHGIDFDRPFAELDERARELALRGTGERVYDVVWRFKNKTREGEHRFRAKWLGLLGYVEEEYERKHADWRAEALDPVMHDVACSACGGERLAPELRSVRFADKSLADLCRLDVRAAIAFFEGLEQRLDERSAKLTAEARREIARRLRLLDDAGLGYLSLDRPASTLSGGEAQRVRLASSLGSGLTGITYVLDEPTIGLHARDTERLLGLLKGLRDLGNTVVVVEHDRDVIRAADYVLDLGPGAGEAGGRLVAQGSPSELMADPATVTGRWLAASAPLDRKPRELGEPIQIRGARAHNLAGIDLDIPTGCLVAVTGVSGSGKTTIVFDVLAASLRASRPVGCAELSGALPASLVVVDQEPIGASSASTPATFLGIFDAIRALFAKTPLARERRWSKSFFSLQGKGGRCEACEGSGRIRFSMDFLPDVEVPCEECGGRRYRAEALECRWREKSIADVLELTAMDALAMFEGEKAIRKPLEVLVEVGLGYVRLGQPTSTLSGGEAQRLKLAAELAKGGRGANLYLFDEPTTGLHPEDTARLLALFDKLVDAGHTLVVVEHDLEVVRRADWVIDLGPEGGDGGGQVVASGTPEAIARVPGSYTGQALLRAAARP
ncbi:MAG: excinuclease ABC subunit UvrA [Myxococcales bacterium]|jgi:excinuclease ABC subunit A